MQTILVCDDDKEIVEAIDIYLQQEGYQVLKAYDGEEALEILKEKEVHLLIIDVMMPRLDGIRATLKIRLLLVKNQGKVFSINQIYESIWNEDAIGADNTVAVHIRHIREKIEINPKEPRYLKVVWGVGYKIDKN